MSLHIAAEKTDIAEAVLMPGDPLRAKYIAETYLTNTKRVNEVRNMYGYTGVFKGVPVTVQASGMGMPSMGIYSHELMTEYDVKRIIRIGTAGAFHDFLNIGSVVMALSASTDSAYAHTYELPGTYAPTASWELIKKAEVSAAALGVPLTAGSVVTCDVFYEANPDWWKKWAKLNVLGVEMETAALYMNAAFNGVDALSLLTMSDHFVSGEKASVVERQHAFTSMMEVALNVAVS